MPNPNTPNLQEIDSLITLCTDRQYQEAAIRAQALTLRFPLFAFGWTVLGEVCKQLGQSENALSHMQKAAALSPSNAGIHNNLGNFLQQLGQLKKAADSYQCALNINPNYAEAHFNFGVSLQGLGRQNEAVISYQRAVQIKPDFAEAHNNLGNTFKELGRLHEAEVCYRRALEINPDSADLHNNLSAVLKDLNRLNEAQISCRKALQFKPDFAGAHNNLGIILKLSGQLIEAEESYRQALQLSPDYAEAHCNLAITLLTRGKFTEGWEENEWRWATPLFQAGCRHFTQPQWRGDMAAGLTLLIHAEQGYGDTLQFCRYASLAAACGLKVIMEVPMPLVRLLHSLSGVDQVIGVGEELPPFDLHCPMLSLPLALKTTLSNIPYFETYLHADKTQVDLWQTRFAQSLHKKYRVGLVWAGNSHIYWPQAAIINQQRSLPPELLAPIFELSEFDFFSLQKEGAMAN